MTYLKGIKATPERGRNAGGKQQEHAEIVSDSEEERVRALETDIIEISSSDENEPETENVRPPRQRNVSPSTQKRRTHKDDHGTYIPRTPLSSMLSFPNNEVIDLTESSPEAVPLSPLKAGSKDSVASLKEFTEPFVDEFLPLYEDDEEPFNKNDGSILILDEPRSSRKPIARPGQKKVSKDTSNPFISLDTIFSSSDDSDSVISPTPSRRRGTTSTPDIVSPTKARRPTKKLQAASEQARREEYAASLFHELNRTVFGDGLPKETKLIWSKRLLTTAGRAKWHRSRDGVHTTEVELASKILDCDERIRNTLSHEMCHIACWIIDKDPKEGHGRLFKAWADKVTRKRRDIEISTRHNYEISYPYEWKCDQCSKTYGRYSKSIRPDECVCGACRVGRLIPLFAQRTPRVAKTSKMATIKPQGSPFSVHKPSPLGLLKGRDILAAGTSSVLDMNGDADVDSDIGLLVTTLQSVQITELS